MKRIKRPVTPLEDFEKALKVINLSKSEYELIDYIRYTGVFSQPMVIKDLRIKSKPPVFSVLCEICRKIGTHIPKHFAAVRDWSIKISEHGIRWDGDLICSKVVNIDGDPLTPEAGTCLYDYLCVHKELFTGFD